MKIEKVLIRNQYDEVVEICVSPETLKKIEKEVEKIVKSHKKLYGHMYPSYKNLIKEIIIKLDERCIDWRNSHIKTLKSKLERERNKNEK